MRKLDEFINKYKNWDYSDWEYDSIRERSEPVKHYMQYFNWTGKEMITITNDENEHCYLLGVTVHKNKWYIFYDRHWTAAKSPEAIFNTMEECIAYIEMLYEC